MENQEQEKLHWCKQTRGSYISYPPGWERWQIPPVEAIAYWDEADRIPIPLLLAALAQASAQKATIKILTRERYQMISIKDLCNFIDMSI